MKRSTLQAVAVLAAAILPAAAAAQQPTTPVLDTVGVRTGAIGIHGLAGGFTGRLDFQGGGATHLLGARAGLGLGELVHVTGYYWRAFDREAGEFAADNAWGGEVQLNLNAGFGITPFVTGGLARVSLDNDVPAQTAAVAGAGVQLPLGPVLMQAGARDYMFGVTGLRGEGSPEEVTHNWQFSAGVLLGFGRGRPQRAVVVARADAAMELAMLRDSLALVAGEARRAAAVAEAALAGDTLLPPELRTPEPGVAVRDTAGLIRNYQSDQRIEIPLPTWGSITLRYGPEPDQAAAPPIVIQAGTPGMAAAPGTAQPPVAAAPPAAPATPPATPAVPGAAQAAPPAQAPTFIVPPQQQQQPTFVLPPQQQVAPQFIPQGDAGLTQAQLDAVAQRVLDGVRFTLLPQLDAAQAQRMNALREDLRRELARIEAVAAGAPAPAAPGAVAALPPAEAAAPVPPATEAPVQPRPEGTPVAPPPVEEAGVAGIADVLAREQEAAAVELAAMQREQALRQQAGALAGRHGALLTAMEMPRGPALVLSDAAFTPDGLSVGTTARGALDDVAALLREHPGAVVFVQAHVDATRPELESQRLSELRAEAVRSLLVLAGVAQDRVLAVGYGHGRPAASDATAAGRAANRRVEIVMGGR